MDHGIPQEYGIDVCIRAIYKDSGKSSQVVPTWPAAKETGRESNSWNESFRVNNEVQKSVILSRVV